MKTPMVRPATYGDFPQHADRGRKLDMVSVEESSGSELANQGNNRPITTGVVEALVPIT